MMIFSLAVCLEMAVDHCGEFIQWSGLLLYLMTVFCFVSSVHTLQGRMQLDDDNYVQIWWVETACTAKSGEIGWRKSRQAMSKLKTRMKKITKLTSAWLNTITMASKCPNGLIALFQSCHMLRFQNESSCKAFIWKWVRFTWKWTCKANTFPYEWSRPKTSFDTDAKGNSEMVYWTDTVNQERISYRCSWWILVSFGQREDIAPQT